MALFGGRVSRFLGSPKSFRFENLRGVQCRHLLVSKERYRDFADGARREFPGSWKLRNQEANGPFQGSSFQVSAASKKFQIWKSSRCALLPLIGLGCTAPGVFAARRGGSSPAAGNSGTRKQMALFGGRVSRFFGSPKSFRFENLRGAHCRHLWVSNARYRDFCGWSEGRTSQQLETQ